MAENTKELHSEDKLTFFSGGKVGRKQRRITRYTEVTEEWISWLNDRIYQRVC